MTDGPLRPFPPSRSYTDSRCYLVFRRFLSRWKRSVCKFVSLVMFEHGEHYIISGALQAQSSSAYWSSTVEGKFPETMCIEQGVVLSCRFAESKVRWISRVLWMAVVGQSSVKSSHRNSTSSSVGANPFLIQIVMLQYFKLVSSSSCNVRHSLLPWDLHVACAHFRWTHFPLFSPTSPWTFKVGRLLVCALEMCYS